MQGAPRKRLKQERRRKPIVIRGKREVRIRRNKQENKERSQREMKSQQAGLIEVNLMNKLFVKTVECVSHLKNIC